MSGLEQQIRQIEAQLKLNGLGDLDEYHRSFIASILLANSASQKMLNKTSTDIAQQMQEVANKVTQSVKPNTYNDLHRMSSWKVLLLKNGWAVILSGVILFLGLALLAVKNADKFKLDRPYDHVIQEKNGKYYIHKDDYTIAHDSKNNPIGIEIKQQ